jgi:hypothetical protein
LIAKTEYKSLVVAYHPSIPYRIDISFKLSTIHNLLLRQSHNPTIQNVYATYSLNWPWRYLCASTSIGADAILLTRPGAGNIGQDTSVYTDGGIVREGVQGESVDGDFSTGRGGAGNIGKSPNLGPQSERTGRRSVDFVPEINAHEGQDEFHTGVSTVKSQPKVLF